MPRPVDLQIRFVGRTGCRSGVEERLGFRVMPRYFFDVHDGKHTVDDVGVELADADAAREQIWNTLPAMAAHRQPDGNMACQLRMDVRDEVGDALFDAALTLVIERAAE